MIESKKRVSLSYLILRMETLCRREKKKLATSKAQQILYHIAATAYARHRVIKKFTDPVNHLRTMIGSFNFLKTRQLSSRHFDE